MTTIPEGCVEFDAQRALAGHPVRTRNGSKLRTKLHDFGEREHWRFSAHVEDATGMPLSWNSYGSTDYADLDLFLVAPAPGPNPSWVTVEEVGDGYELCEAKDGEEWFRMDDRVWIEREFGETSTSATWRRRKQVEPVIRPPTPQELMGAWVRKKHWLDEESMQVSNVRISAFIVNGGMWERIDNPDWIERGQRTAPGTHPSEGKWIDWMVPINGGKP